jgi:hypothetical protein
MERPRLRPTWRGLSVAVIAITVLAVEVATGDSALLLLLVVVALPLVITPVVVIGRARRADGTDIHLIVAPPFVPVGARCDLLVQLTNPAGAALPPLSLERPSDHWSVGVPKAQASSRRAPSPVRLAPDVGRLIRVGGVGSDENASLTLSLPTRRRGVFRIDPLRLWVHDPFALFGLTVAIASPVTVVVHPPADVGLALPAIRPGSRGSTQFGDGPADVHSDDPGGEWSGLRPYEPGDRLHLLSWQAEARYGALLVHDFRPDTEDVVTIVLDDRAGVHRRGAFERALGVLHGLASATEGRTTDYDVSTFSGRRVHGSTSPDGLVALLEFLADTQPTRSNYDADSPASSLPGGVVVITTPTAVPSLPGSVDHGSVIVVQ